MLHTNLHTKVAEYALPIHQACLDLAPRNSEFQMYYRSIICSSPLPLNAFTHDLKSAGVAHFITGSGTHLALLSLLFDSISQRFRFAKIVGAISLWTFAAISLLSGAVIRILVARGLQILNRRYKLFWTPAQVILISGFVSLAFCPEWWSSLGFLISWGAALIFSLWRSQTKLWRNLALYVLLLPFLLPIGVPSPISILLNWILFLPISLGLFPMSFLSIIIPALTKATDVLWHLLELAVQYPSPSLRPLPIAIFWQWLYLFTLNIWVIFWPFHTKKATSCLGNFLP